MTKVMKIGGWKDIKTMQIYLRLAGVDEKGATDGLRYLPSDEAVMGVFGTLKSKVRFIQSFNYLKILTFN